MAREPSIIYTILGSCVSVCLYCPKNQTGAMCHGIMPSHPGAHEEDSFRFVESSVNYMIDSLTGGGKICPTANLVAKIFGGANVLLANTTKLITTPSIGNQNIEVARRVLLQHKIRLATEKVGGSSGCKIYFYSHTGDVFYKKLSR